MDIRAEVYAFLTMVYCGVIMGILFDIYREKKRHFRKIPIIDPIEDILFWIVQAGVLFLFLYWSNYGEIRMFSILGVIAGAIVYHYTLSYALIKILDITFGAIAGFFHIISITCGWVLHSMIRGMKKAPTIKFFNKRKRN